MGSISPARWGSRSWVCGPYSSIDRKLKRPYADEFHLGAELSLQVERRERSGCSVAMKRMYRGHQHWSQCAGL